MRLAPLFSSTTQQIKNLDSKLHAASPRSSRPSSKNTKFNLLDISLHNINRIKHDKYILKALLSELFTCDVVCLNEINLTQKEGKFI